MREERRKLSRHSDVAGAIDYMQALALAKLNNIDPQAWLTDLLARIAEHPFNRLDELLPWNWSLRNAAQAA